MTSLINKIKNLALIPILAGSLNSCRDASEDFCKKGKYNGYDVTINFDGAGRRASIHSNDSMKPSGLRSVIYGVEQITNLKDKKIFSSIKLQPDNPVESSTFLKYANLDSLEKVYNFVYKNGEDCY